MTIEQRQIPNLRTVRQFVAEHPAFTMGGIRNYIYFEEFNGLKACGVIKRIGCKILIDVDAFFRWIDTQNK